MQGYGSYTTDNIVRSFVIYGRFHTQFKEVIENRFLWILNLYVYYFGVFTLPDTETDQETDKNGLYRIVWRCSYCTEADTNIDSH